MWIDIALLIVLIVAVWQGRSKGLIVAVCSFAAWIIGLAAALKLSSVAAVYLNEHTSINAQWLPFLSFILVFVATVLLIRWGAKLLEKAMDLSFLGGLNKLLGVLLYSLLYTLIFSVFLYFIVKMELVSQATLDNSKVYPLIGGVAPVALQAVTMIIPAFTNVFEELERFFEHVASKPH